MTEESQVSKILKIADEQIAYWQEKVDEGKTFEDCSSEDGDYTPMGDEEAYDFGKRSGRRDAAIWFKGVIESLAEKS